MTYGAASLYLVAVGVCKLSEVLGDHPSKDEQNNCSDDEPWQEVHESKLIVMGQPSHHKR